MTSSRTAARVGTPSFPTWTLSVDRLLLTSGKRPTLNDVTISPDPGDRIAPPAVFLLDK
jgi:hypothetical protein